MRSTVVRCTLLLALCCAPRAFAQAIPSADPAAAEREELRRFLDQGPALLLPPAERLRIAALPVPEGLAAARAFLAGDPLPETPANELALGIELRQRLAWSEGLSLRDARGLMLFLHGTPRERLEVDCGDTFHPLEIWSYGPVESPQSAVLYRPRADAFFALWRPTESKRALYMPEMEYYLEQWEELRGLTSGKRPDRILCKESKTVDAVTGVQGLFRFEKDRPTDAMMDAMVAPPAELAAWAREAAATVLEKSAPILPVDSARVTFPERREQRMLARLRVVLPAGVGLGVAGEEASRESRLTVAGRLELAGAPFEEFRNRFVMQPPAATTPVVLVAERLLRPGGPYILELELRDEVSGRTAWISQGFTVPKDPVPEPETPLAGAQVVLGQETGITKWGRATLWC